MKAIYCQDCAAQMNNDEVAFCLRYFGKQAGTLLCAECAATLLSCERQEIIQRINKLKDAGCSYFERRYTN